MSCARRRRKLSLSWRSLLVSLVFSRRLPVSHSRCPLEPMPKAGRILDAGRSPLFLSTSRVPFSSAESAFTLPSSATEEMKCCKEKEEEEDLAQALASFTSPLAGPLPLTYTWILVALSTWTYELAGPTRRRTVRRRSPDRSGKGTVLTLTARRYEVASDVTEFSVIISTLP
uniref:Putative secreted protein n=1 Tax=Ixodes ricinus TaxID=34613 RepID=A0A6B0UYP4_IXORI